MVSKQIFLPEDFHVSPSPPSSGQGVSSENKRSNHFIEDFTSCSCFIEFIEQVGEKRSLFPNKFNKFNNTGAQMLDSFNHMALKQLKNHIFSVKTSKFCHLLRNDI